MIPARNEDEAERAKRGRWKCISDAEGKEPFKNFQALKSQRQISLFGVFALTTQKVFGSGMSSEGGNFIHL